MALSASAVQTGGKKESIATERGEDRTFSKMQGAVFDAPTPHLPVQGRPGLHVPVGRVFCVGKNYAKHAVELGCDPEKEPPVFFLKAASCVVHAPEGTPLQVRYPAKTSLLHHEVELVAVIGRQQEPGTVVPREDALAYVWGWCVGLDMTRRDVQNEARQTGGPWDMSKSFDDAAPCADVVPRDAWELAPAARVWCDVNGQLRQRGTLSEMTWGVPDIIHHLSAYVTLSPGDVIFTGTPEGVGEVRAGDTVTGGVEGLPGVCVKYFA